MMQGSQAQRLFMMLPFHRFNSVCAPQRMGQRLIGIAEADYIGSIIIDGVSKSRPSPFFDSRGMLRPAGVLAVMKL